MNVHPELADTLATLPIKRSSFADIELTRKNFTAMMGKLPLDVSNVDIGVTKIIGPDDNPVPLGIYRPKGATGPLPAVLHFHGGSFAYGRSEPDQDRTAVAICEQAGAITISVDYRLAPQHRYPAGVEDCYSALEWVADNAIELGIDPERIAITGKSAGGGLSAAVALMSRDRGGPKIAYQSMFIPTVDDRNDTESARRITDPRIVNGQAIVETYDNYLPDRSNVSPYAAPARATDLTGLPPAYVLVCELDPLYDEGLDYARRLMDAGVQVTVRNVPGAWHLFEMHAPETELARTTTAHWLGDLRSALFS